jgi:hypothetical protein
MPAPHTHKEAAVPNTPTSKQLRFLKSLADRTGQTFTYPKTAVEASREIKRLQGARSMTRTERYVETTAVRDQIATGPIHDATRVGEDEIAGRGSTATWAHNRDQEPTVIEDRPTPRRLTPVVGARTELARYAVNGGERVLYGQRIDGVVRVTDRPAQPGGRSYLVERGLASKAELDALIADYLQQAESLDMPPVAARLQLDVLDAAA